MTVDHIGFESDSNVTDFALEFTKATRRRDSASFLALAASDETTDFQKAAALEQAALFDRANAEEISERIPIDAVRMNVLMRVRPVSDVIDQFAVQEIAQWPFWKRGDGYFARGRAHAAMKNGDEAEKDLTAALQWTSDRKIRQSIYVAIGRNRESNLGDDSGAVSAYRAVIDQRDRLGGSDEFTAAQAIARILTSQGKFGEALATLARIDTDKQRGTWRYSTLIARGDAHRAAGNTAKARRAYQDVLADKDSDMRFRKMAEQRLESF